MNEAALLDDCAIALGDVSATDAFGLSLLLDGNEMMQTVLATGPGVFRTRRRQADVPAAGVGRFFVGGDIVGFLQCGALLMPVVIPQDGWLLVAAPDGVRVEHGSPIVRILRAAGVIIP
jgi:hypothetical protein